MSTTTDPTTRPLDTEHFAAIKVATATAAAAGRMLTDLLAMPEVADALSAWAAATETFDAPPERRAVVSANYEAWMAECGLDALSDAAWPIIDLARILALDMAPSDTPAAVPAEDAVIYGVAIPGEDIDLARLASAQLKPYTEAIHAQLASVREVLGRLFDVSAAIGAATDATPFPSYEDARSADDAAQEQMGQVTGFTDLYNLLSDLSEAANPEELVAAYLREREQA